MRLFTTTLILTIIIGLLASCSSTKNIGGKYRSNFARLGFFVTEITFNKDSSFAYHFYGDVLNQKAEGHYSFSRKKLHLKYEFPPIDTSQYAYFRSVGFPIEDDMKRWYASFPHLFFIRHKKLFLSDNKGHIIRRARPISIFHKHKRKFYLEHIQ